MRFQYLFLTFAAILPVFIPQLGITQAQVHESFAQSIFLPDSTPISANTYTQQATEIDIYDDCNLNPSQYDFYAGQLTLEAGNCNGFCFKEPIIIFGHSMEPTIKDRTLVIVKTHEHNMTLKVGDIVLYDATKAERGFFLQDTPYIKTTLHRIVAIVGNGTKFVIKGDNRITNSVCEYIPRSAIKGVLVGVYGA